MKQKKISPLMKKYKEIIPRRSPFEDDMDEGERWLEQPSPLKIVDSHTTSESFQDANTEE